MATIFAYVLFSSLFALGSIEGKVIMVLMDEDAAVSYKDNHQRTQNQLVDEDTMMLYKQKLINSHDSLLQSLLPVGSYTKLYSYTHLINGFAVHTTSNEAYKIIEQAGVRMIHEDMKMKKLTTHSPEFLEIPEGVWPQLGGAPNAGQGVVIGIVDTGINPGHPSFANQYNRKQENTKSQVLQNGRFKGRCETGEMFPATACNGKIVGARHFSRGASAAGYFNITQDYASPFDTDGHGSHTASIAAGNYQVPVIVDGFNYGNASGMAPGARLAIYRATYPNGGAMSDVVAAIDQAVEDGVDVLSLSIGPASVPSGPASFLDVLEIELLFAARAGVLVVQSVGNDGPSMGTSLSFSPWITSVAASTTNRIYSNSMTLGNGMNVPGTGLSPPSEALYPLAAAADVKASDSTFLPLVHNCMFPENFNPSLVQGKIIICSYAFNFEVDKSNVNNIAKSMSSLGAAGFILDMDPDIGTDHLKGSTTTFPIPGIVLNTFENSEALRDYYHSNTTHETSGAVFFGATAKIHDGRQAVYKGQGPVVSYYSSRGPDVNNIDMQTADVLKPNIMAPGTLIWGAWSPMSQGDKYLKGQNFALMSGTSMATPHVAGVAALIKQRHPYWSPAAIASAIMTSAKVTDISNSEILAQRAHNLIPATPFDYGSGFINPSRALNPGLVFDLDFHQYIEFLCAVPGVDERSVRRAVGQGCPAVRMPWCSDLNIPSITVANLVGSRKIVRTVTNVGQSWETYEVLVREPAGISVTVSPRVFSIEANGRRNLNIVLQGKEATNSYSFGELMLVGDKKHEVRVPLTVSVASTWEQKGVLGY